MPFEFYDNLKDNILSVCNNYINTIKKNDNLQLVQNNFEAIASDFNWEKINEQYLQFFKFCLEKSSFIFEIKSKCYLYGYRRLV